MYFWNVNALKSELAGEGISEAQAFKYLLIYVIAEAFMWATLPLNRPHVWDHLSLVAAGLITVAGTVYCYQKNGGSGGSRFLYRYFALGWVCPIRWFVQIALPSMFVLWIIVKVQSDAELTETPWYLLLSIVTSIILYLKVGAAVRDVAQKSRDST